MANELTKIHKLYLDGETLEKISELLDISISRVKAHVLKQRNINPDIWPRRFNTSTMKSLGMANDCMINVIRYDCGGCGFHFMYELTSDSLLCRVVCPACSEEEGLTKIGMGVMYLGSLEEKEEQPKVKSLKSSEKTYKSNYVGRTIKPYWTEEERAFLCFMYNKIYKKTLAHHFGRTKQALFNQYKILKDNGKFDHYYEMGKNMFEEGKVSLEGLG